MLQKLLVQIDAAAESALNNKCVLSMQEEPHPGAKTQVHIVHSTAVERVSQFVPNLIVVYSTVSWIFFIGQLRAWSMSTKVISTPQTHWQI